MDDEQLICEEFKDILEDDGNNVEVAYNGLEALKKIREAEYDLVFLDVLMPHMEGREVFEEIKKISKEHTYHLSTTMTPKHRSEVVNIVKQRLK